MLSEENISDLVIYMKLPRYIAFADQVCCPETLPARINRLYQLGVPAVRLRVPEASDRQKLDWLQKIKKPAGSLLLVSDRPDLARLSSADGVHLTAGGLDAFSVRRLLNDSFLVGASTHSLTEVRNAASLGLDYVIFSPIFPTPSKPDLKEKDCHGLEGLQQAAEATSLPVYALGEITAERIPACLQAGAYGAAGISALFAPTDPTKNWKKIKSALNEL